MGHNQPTHHQTVFDIPTLVGLRINDIRQRLGVPYFEDPSGIPGNLAICTWKRGNISLMVQYYRSNGKVYDLFLNIGNTNAKNRLLVSGNLTTTDSRYGLYFVDVIGKPGIYTGVRITPTN